MIGQRWKHSNVLASRLVLIGQHYTQPQKATNKDLLATTIQITLNPHPPTHNTKTGGGVEQHKRVTTFAVVIVVGKRPETFRTRKLSPQTPMVLHPTECGRVGHRRNITQTNPLLDHHSKRGFTTVHKHKTQSAKPKTVCTLTLNSTYSPTRAFPLFQTALQSKLGNTQRQASGLTHNVALSGGLSP